MRLLLVLRSKGTFSYLTNYHHKLQGFLYALLRGSDMDYLHNLPGYKFFSFSNIFPIQSIHEGDTRNLIIASPDEIFIRAIFRNLLENYLHTPIYIGHMVFELESIKLLNPRIGQSCRFVAATPIIVRIPRHRFSSLPGGNWETKYDYTYWRNSLPLELFVEQITANLAKKYRAYFDRPLEEEHLFPACLFLKQVCNHVIIGGREVKLIGSLWEFYFEAIDQEMRRVLRFALDTGLGELNSLGFGFINKVRRNRAN